MGRPLNCQCQGLNNKDKVVSHRAYGYRYAHMYMTALYHCLGDLQMPNFFKDLCDKPYIVKKVWFS